MNKKLKNIIIVYDYAEINGGAAKVAIQSAIALAKMDYQVYFFAASGPVNQELQNSSVSVICLWIDDINHGSKLKAIKKGIWNKKAGNKFRDFLNQFSPIDTVIHIHGWVKALSSSIVKAAHKFPIIVTLHDYFAVCPNGGFYNYRKQKICTKKPMSPECIFCNCDKRSFIQKSWRVIRQIVQDKSIRKNKNIIYISISQKIEDIIKPYVKSQHFCRIINPIQLAETQIDDCSKSNIYLYIGRLSEEKGIDLFCEAITQLKKENNIEGVVVGDGPFRDYLAEKYKDIYFEGWKMPKEVRNYIQKARALILPSKWYEGAPLTIIEAMSAGLPCIVSDCTSAVEQIIDGENGLIFVSNNYESLKEKILQTLDTKVMKSIETNLKKTFDNTPYSENTHIKSLVQLYEQWINQ